MNLPTEILIATGNRGKLAEFLDMLGNGQFIWRGLADYPACSPVEETGHTFRANACLKAAGYARHFNTWALADDSGLEVTALQGKPGVHSARWAEIHSAGRGDADNNLLLLEQLKDVADADRSARFVCALALSDPHGQIMLTAQDQVEGTLLHAPRGTNGFGYDPLFYVSSLGKTTAQLHPAEKHEISHRGKALLRLKAMLNEMMGMTESAIVLDRSSVLKD